MVCPEVWDGLRVALRAKSAGIWPVAGGSQDQARAFLQLYDVVADEVARIEAEEMKSASK